MYFYMKQKIINEIRIDKDLTSFMHGLMEKHTSM